jgi:hypothetical protein
LQGFHFFFNIFSLDIDSKTERNATEYKAGDDFILTESVLSSHQNNLFLEDLIVEEEIAVLVLFHDNFKIGLKLTELFCCDDSDAVQVERSKHKLLSIDDKIKYLN